MCINRYLYLYIWYDVYTPPAARSALPLRAPRRRGGPRRDRAPRRRGGPRRDRAAPDQQRDKPLHLAIIHVYIYIDTYIYIYICIYSNINMHMNINFYINIIMDMNFNIDICTYIQ